MKIIIGLGNPWEKYQNTRHNAGFLIVDFLQKQWNFSDWQDSKFEAVISEGVFSGEKIFLLKPLTFMNLSWNSVQKFLHFYKIPATEILVISDDIDMEFWKIRLKNNGSHGGQNGLRDIIVKLGTSDFARLKIGIWRHENISVSDWVLSKFSEEEKKKLESEIFPNTLEKIENFLQT